MASTDSPLTDVFPSRPIHRFTKPISRFLHVEAASGIVLLICSLLALGLANSSYSYAYLAFWKTPIGFRFGDFSMIHSLKHWINDALMAIFFFVIGLEVKREIVLGELKSLRSATLPVAAAIGGMVIPAAIYYALQMGEAGARGWGIPMATDIAFVVGCMAVLGRRIPGALRVILLSIAIVDDIGAILVIAFGYTETIHTDWLIMGIVGIGIILIMQRLGVRSMGVYLIVGIAIWVGFHESGIHATIAGVVLGLLTPAKPYLQQTLSGEFLKNAGDFLHGEDWVEDSHQAAFVKKSRKVTKESISPLEYLIYVLHPWVAFVIMPVFALANAGVSFAVSDLLSSTALAVIAGLVIGKPIGILAASWVFLKTGLAKLPAAITNRHLIGGGFLAGIGFTMALFIAGLAFKDEALLRPAKVGVLFGSFLSAVIGIGVLMTASPVPAESVGIPTEDELVSDDAASPEIENPESL